MLRIRLSRVGKKKQPAYRIVVADSRSPRDGAFLQTIGHYNPLTDPATLVVKEDLAVRWLQEGAQPSDTAAKLLTRTGVMEKAGREPFVHQAKSAPPKSKEKAAPAPAKLTAAQPAAASEPVAEEPAVEEPAVEEPATEEPAVEEPAAEEQPEPEATVAEGETPEQPESTE